MHWDGSLHVPMPSQKPQVPQDKTGEGKAQPLTPSQVAPHTPPP